jgi:lipopolysaccharide transport system ATP-binding protein
MYLRLAFAVAAHLDPEILMIDEVLAVGDAAFQKKCLGKMGEVAQGGRTILFVSHNMLAIKSLCKRAIWLEQGRMFMEGLAPQVVDQYMMRGLREQTTSATFLEDPTLRIQVLHVELIPHVSVQGNEMLLFKCMYIVREKLENVLLCVEVRNSSDVSAFYSNDAYLNDSRKRKVGIHTVTLAIPTYLLSPGAYLVAFGFWEPGHGPEHFPDARLTFWREEAITQLSTHGISWPSVIYTPATWNYIENENSSTKDGICGN